MSRGSGRLGLGRWDPRNGCHEERRQTRWTRTGHSPVLHLPDWTPAGRRKYLLLEWMPESDQETQENSQPERATAKGSSVGAGTELAGGGRAGFGGRDQGPRAKETGQKDRRGLPSGSVPQRVCSSAQALWDWGAHGHRGAALQLRPQGAPGPAAASAELAEQPASTWTSKNGKEAVLGQLGDKA